MGGRHQHAGVASPTPGKSVPYSPPMFHSPGAIAIQIGPVTIRWYGVLMAIATLFFYLGRHRYVHVPPKPGGRLGALDAVAGSLMFLAIGHLYITPADWGWVVRGVISVVALAAGLAVFFYRQSLEQDDGFLAIVLYNLRAKLGGVTPPPSATSGATSSASVRAVDEPPEYKKPAGDADSPLVKSAFWSRFWGPAIARFGLIRATVIHRHGTLSPGEPIVQVMTLASHRRAAFEGAEFLMDYLKTDAPFWKQEATATGDRWVEARPEDDAARDRWKP